MRIVAHAARLNAANDDQTTSSGARVLTAALGLTSDQTRQVLTAACRAPSLHNSQPWTFRVDADRIEMHLEPARALPASDPDGREARLGCGAALFNLRLTLARYGVEAKVAVYPEGDGGPVAVVEYGGEVRLSPLRADLERAIVHRRTNRHPFFEAEVSLAHQHTLARAAQAERASLALITEPGPLAQLGAWAAAAHRIQLADPAWVAEWTAWTRREGTADGVPSVSAGPRPAPQDTFTLRDFGRPGRPDRAAGKNFEAQPLLAVLGTRLDGPNAQLQAGQALQRVLLTATSVGLAASFLSQLIEVESVRGDLRDLIGGAISPQTVLRIGFGGPVPGTPRLPLSASLLPTQFRNVDRDDSTVRNPQLTGSVSAIPGVNPE